jgi:hypothetical protein
MSAIVTMSSTVGSYLSGQTYRVRSKQAELFVAQSKATKLPTKKISGPGAGKEGV